MFEVGAKYEFKMLEGGGDVTFWGTVESYEHPLLKLADSEPMSLQINYGAETQLLGTSIARPGKIINVTSPSFISAQKQSE
ncbi:hypothetical protein U8P76_10725 [Rhizobium johnstonii]|uniref:hypothetical protein n=1 Tax=Rhizobium leguminosarum TaxID=384 RepID=UPI00102FCCE2|nr:hypothetical protein [Rhizobium leguminosarum]TBG20623.1 hypothetical protein ELG81_08685 [Rhizobium leguminosarum]TBG46539.1 hypothetical protein ELG75_08700 [Rhizobium leguminosarum]TBG79510.1 hypothetical protein ELG76_09035 [Rhizobium leguminosarum]WSG97223.1 hypothetical protein U8P76_10725 [Rhizobium johnstonii]